MVEVCRLPVIGCFIGWIGFLLSIGAVVLFGMTMYSCKDLSEMLRQHMCDPTITKTQVRVVFITIVTIYFVMNLINLFTSLAMLVGIARKMPLLLLPWMLNAGAWLLCSSGYFLYFSVTTYASPRLRHLPVSLTTAALTLVLQYIVWLTVMALFLQMRDQQQECSDAECYYT